MNELDYQPALAGLEDLMGQAGFWEDTTTAGTVTMLHARLARLSSREDVPPRPPRSDDDAEDSSGDGGVREPREPKPSAPAAPAVAPEPVKAER